MNEALQTLNETLGYLVGWVWSFPIAIGLVTAGVALSILLKFIQVSGFNHALSVIRGKYDNERDPGEITHFQALCTALSATVGLGNIAGVAVAIGAGGPGALFWMLLMGFFGMATKFAECTLSIMYRKVDSNGRVYGGPMHYIEQGLGKSWKPMAAFFSVATVAACVGAGNMFQSNQLASVLETNWSISPIITGLVLSILTGVVIIGGIKRISSVTSKIVPFMGIFYIAGSLFIIFTNIGELPALFGLVLADAFSGEAVAGSFFGVMIIGVQRAVFSNEAGIGSAPIAHAAASTKEPVREGLVASLGPLVDTILVCTMTASVILISGAWKYSSGLDGVVLTVKAFDSGIAGFGHYFIPVAVIFFCYSTLISWSYYGENAIYYLFGIKAVLPYKIIFCLACLAGALWKLTPILNFSDMMIVFMMIPNLIAVGLLFPKIKKETQNYFRRLKAGEF